MDEMVYELRFLAESQAERLRMFRQWLEKHPDSARNGARETALSIVTELEANIALVIGELDGGVVELVEVSARLRVLQGLVGAVCVSLDWQSPSYLHALHSEAGTQTGIIEGTISDYKRDHHHDADVYERKFVAEYVDRRSPLPVHAWVTSSGMSAFTTLVEGLRMEGILPGPIVMGKNCYFENKILLRRMFPGLITVVDEMNVDEVVETVRAKQPAVIFLDSICNTETLAMPDLAGLLPALASACSRSTYLVLDNSGLGPSCQPLIFMPVLPSRLKLYVFESLNKHHQFGMDRVTGGIIWTQEIFSGWLQSARMHLGTNIPDASVIALPPPNRTLLDARLARLWKNAVTVANALDEHIKVSPNSPFSSVVYPGHGASLVLKFQENKNVVRLSKQFIDLATKEARRVSVDLTAGTSFGLNTTRIYLTALLSSKTASPFLRISVGTESVSQLDKLIDVFKRTIDAL